MYPDSPPLAARDFTYQDRDHFAAVYEWAGSIAKMAAWLRSEHVQVSTSTLNQWRAKHAVPIVQDVYRLRSGPSPEEDRPPDEEIQRAFLEYLQGRKTPVGVPPSARRTAGGYARAIIGGDLHFPHHDEAAFEVFLGVVETVDPAEVILNGDTWDFSQLGSYPRNPASFVPLQADIDRCRTEVLARVSKAAPHANRRLVMGNHELGRWLKYLWTRAPELASLRCLDLEAILGLGEMGWLYEPDGVWLTPELLISHGDRHTNSLGGGSAQSARKEMLDVGTSGVTGHVHKGGLFYRKDSRGYRCWAEGFCLCDADKMRAAGVTARKHGHKVEDWHAGLLMVEYEPGGSAFFLHPLPILTTAGRTYTVLDGQEIVA